MCKHAWMSREKGEARLWIVHQAACKAAGIRMCLCEQSEIVQMLICCMAEYRREKGQMEVLAHVAAAFVCGSIQRLYRQTNPSGTHVVLQRYLCSCLCRTPMP